MYISRIDFPYDQIRMIDLVEGCNSRLRVARIRILIPYVLVDG